jgi:hypothetical protein
MFCGVEEVYEDRDGMGMEIRVRRSMTIYVIYNI